MSKGLSKVKVLASRRLTRVQRGFLVTADVILHELEALI